MTNGPPEEIRQLAAGSPVRFKENLQKFWQQSAHDFVAAGLSPELVADSLLLAAMAYQIKVKGEHSALRFLRLTADLLEGQKK